MTIEQQIRATAERYGVPPDLAVSVAWRESNFNQAARGAAGEVGMFQLMPGTAAEVGVNPYDLQGNIEGGVRYLKKQYDSFGDWTTALWAYNAGPGNVAKGRVPDRTKSYASDILDRAGEVFEAGAHWVVDATAYTLNPFGWFGETAAPRPAPGVSDALLIGAGLIGVVSLALLARR